jgi:hypothetical protein
MKLAIATRSGEVAAGFVEDAEVLLTVGLLRSAGRNMSAPRGPTCAKRSSWPLLSLREVRETFRTGMLDV